MTAKPYEIYFTIEVQRKFDTLHPKIRNQIWKKIVQLVNNPRPVGAEKIKGTNPNEHYYRIRSGDYRIIYTIKDNKLTVSVVSIGHRREVYKKFFN